MEISRWLADPGLSGGAYHRVEWQKRIAPRQGRGKGCVVPSTHLSLHYHVVFSTKDRQPSIGGDWMPRLHAYLGPSGTPSGVQIRGDEWSGGRFVPPEAGITNHRLMSVSPPGCWVGLTSVRLVSEQPSHRLMSVSPPGCWVGFTSVRLMSDQPSHRLMSISPPGCWVTGSYDLSPVRGEEPL